MSHASDRGEAGVELWVVDVTAPLASGRVHEVAADAAARLKLPVEKLIALLENRIGPVTKPLPHASAARVAEVLNLSGADVNLRPAEPDDEPAPVPSEPESEAEGDAARDVPDAPAEASASKSVAESPGDGDGVRTRTPSAQAEGPTEPAGHSLDESTRRAAARSADDADTASDTDTTPDADTASDSDTAPDADAAGERASASAAATPDVENATASPADVATPSRTSTTSTTAPASEAPKSETVPPRSTGTKTPSASTSDDPWGALERDDDDAMLGGWHRGPESTIVSGTSKDAGRPRSSTPAPPSREATPSATSATPGDRRPIAGRPPAQEIEDDDESSWSYGLRDPFAEADAHERRLRRWVLMIALLIASTVFVALQWAYSRSAVGDRGVANFDQGLTAYRDGAFVSAARAWIPLAESGDPEAMFMLGWMAEFGQGRAWSNREAASWYRQAAERGQSAAQLRLGDLHRRGLGVDQDLDAALRWYLAAAEAGVPRAQREAALVLARFGRLDEARVWLERAARTDPDAAAWWSLAHEGDGATDVSP